MLDPAKFFATPTGIRRVTARPKGKESVFHRRNFRPEASSTLPSLSLGASNIAVRYHLLWVFPFAWVRSRTAPLDHLSAKRPADRCAVGESLNASDYPELAGVGSRPWNATESRPAARKATRPSRDQPGDGLAWGDGRAWGCNAPRRTRTCNLRFRRPMLYPIELGVLSGTSFYAHQGAYVRPHGTYTAFRFVTQSILSTRSFPVKSPRFKENFDNCCQICPFIPPKGRGIAPVRSHRRLYRRPAGRAVIRVRTLLKAAPSGRSHICPSTAFVKRGDVPRKRPERHG